MRCFTVLLACGWLLFQPPLSDDYRTVQANKPLQLWGYVGAHDTARECENAKEAEIKHVRGLMDKPELDKNVASALFTRTLAAQCIPSDALGFKFK